jgi:hypothetical protein
MTEVYLKKIRQDECPSCGKALRQPQTEQGLSVGEIGLVYASAIKAVAEQQTDALKKARDAIRGLLDIAPEENLDSEQAGRAYAALHEIGTALAALEQSK